MRFAVWRNTIAVVAGYVVAIVVLDRLLLRRTISSRPLALALAFTMVQTAVILVMLIALFVWKRRNVLRTRRSEHFAPAIQEAIALHALGEDQIEVLRRLRDSSRYDVRETLLTMAATMRGEARARIARLAQDLALFERSSDVELQSIRDRIRLTHAADFADVVAWSARRPLLARAIVADELRPYAGEIQDTEILRALSSTDRDVVLTTLEMLRAWRRVMRVSGFTMLLANTDARVRAAAFAALSYVAASEPPDVIAGAIEAALRHEDARVRAAAARAAARAGVTSVTAALAARVADPDRAVALASAWALASFGYEGLETLEAMLAEPDRSAAAVAFEAWEKAALGRLELA